MLKSVNFFKIGFNILQIVFDFNIKYEEYHLGFSVIISRQQKVFIFHYPDLVQNFLVHVFNKFEGARTTRSDVIMIDVSKKRFGNF